MARGKYKQPIVIKRIVWVHKPGKALQWKVAYADFVTAMMAFFLLLWLINTATPQQKKGIAEHFTPTTGLKDSLGVGFEGGRHSSREGRETEEMADPRTMPGAVNQGEQEDVENAELGKPEDDTKTASSLSRPLDFVENSGDLRNINEGVNQALREDEDLKKISHSIQVSETKDGIKIDLLDYPRDLIFAGGGVELTDMGKRALRAITGIVLMSPNRVAINAHSEVGWKGKDPRYTSWELSIARANAARRFMMQAGLEQDRIASVIGHADRDPLLPHEPFSSRNRRISVLLIRNSYMKLEHNSEGNTMPAIQSIRHIDVKSPKQ